MIRISILAAVTAGLVLSGCSQSGVPSQPTSNEMALRQDDAIASKAESGASLYVANNGATDVTVYGLDGSGPNQTIQNGLNLGLRAIAFDSASNLYVAMAPRRGTAGAVNEYAHGTSKIVRKIKVVRPVALAVDKADNLYVLGLKSVEVFAPGSTTPSETITNGIKNPTAMVLNRSGKIYVGNGENAESVTIYSASGKLIQTITQGVFSPTAMTFDKQGRLYVVNGYPNDTVAVYQGIKTTDVWKTINSTNNGELDSIALDNNQNVYVASTDNSVQVFSAAPDFTFIHAIKDQVNSPSSLALDAQDDLFVANTAGTVTKYLPGSSEVDTIISNGIKVPIAIAIK